MIRRVLRNWDWILAVVTLLLSVIGILVLYSITYKAKELAVPVDWRMQLLYVGLGLAAMLVTALIDYRIWSRLTTWLYFLALGLLLVVAVVGKSALGATRWIDLGFFQFQPSELAKLALIFSLARFLADYYEQMDQLKYLLISLVYVLLPMSFVLAQPDLGTALVMLVVWLVMVLSAKARPIYLAGMALASLAALPVVLRFLQPYQRQRLVTFFNPMADPLGTGYNVVQSTIAVGSGQLTGRGLAAGSQSQLNFLPSQHTDFIFAVLAEKMGFVGGMLLIALFGVLLWRGLAIGWKAADRFGFFLCVGVVTMFLFHFFVNVGMNMGIMPVTGIPLPFVSYGGTSLLIGMLAVGLLQSVATRRKLEFNA